MEASEPTLTTGEAAVELDWVPERISRFVGQLATIWGEASPDQALSWALSFENEQLIRGASSTIFPTWVQEDRQKAVHWLNNAPLSTEVREFLEEFRDGSPSPR